MDIAANKALARRYFSEMVDKTSDQLLEELWAEDCVAHRPEVADTINGREAFRRAFNRFVAPYREIVTTFHSLVAENDLVVAHLAHKAVHRGGACMTRPCNGQIGCAAGASLGSPTRSCQRPLPVRSCNRQRFRQAACRLPCRKCAKKRQKVIRMLLPARFRIPPARNQRLALSAILLQNAGVTTVRNPG